MKLILTLSTKQEAMHSSQSRIANCLYGWKLMPHLSYPLGNQIIESLNQVDHNKHPIKHKNSADMFLEFDQVLQFKYNLYLSIPESDK